MAGSVRLRIKAGMTNSYAIRKHVLLEIRLKLFSSGFQVCDSDASLAPFFMQVETGFMVLCYCSRIGWYEVETC